MLTTSGSSDRAFAWDCLTATLFAAAAMYTFVRQADLFVKLTVVKQLTFRNPKAFAWVSFYGSAHYLLPALRRVCAWGIKGIVRPSPPQAVHLSPEKLRDGGLSRW